MPSNQNHQSTVARASNGAPIETLTASQTAGADGPILLQDFTFLDQISHFDRERIPERVVHAKGAGAMGYFQVTDPEFIQSICKAKIFQQPTTTACTVRFSTVGGESGSADTARDPRGFAMKFFTEDGVWDLVGNNTPIFFIRDPILFPSFIHTQKRNPVTHLKDPDAFWDFISLRPETIHQVSFLFSNRGTPDGYRFMNGYGSHTFVNVNDAGDVHYVKYHFKTDQGIRNLSAKEADQLASGDSDYSTRDLFDAIAKGIFPSWTLYVQVMTPQQASACAFNPFDLTKVWPHSDYPLHQVGRMVLNENPTDYFTQVEQLAFSPSHMVPGIEPSPDKMLQARLFSYPDTHRHRLGANYQQLPCNSHADVNEQYQRDGPMAYQVPKGGPNYFPNSFQGPTPDPAAGKYHDAKVSGSVGRYETGHSEDNFSQCREFYNQVLSPSEQEDLTQNIADHLSHAQEFIRANVLSVLQQVDASYAAKVRGKVRPVLSAQPKPPPAPLNPPRNVCPYGYKAKL